MLNGSDDPAPQHKARQLALLGAALLYAAALGCFIGYNLFHKP